MRKNIPTSGKKVSVINKNLFEKIRKRLNLTKKQLPDKLIKEFLIFSNRQIGRYIIDNPEGFQLSIGTQLNGVLAVSKHLPKEMRENKFEKLEDIDRLQIPEWRKKIYRKRYSTSLTRRLNMATKYKDDKLYHINTETFFYSYKIMWFNHRNCKIKKAATYEFVVAPTINHELHSRINEGVDYYELNFNDFYRYKIKPI